MTYVSDELSLALRTNGRDEVTAAHLLNNARNDSSLLVSNETVVYLQLRTSALTNIIITQSIWLTGLISPWITYTKRFRLNRPLN
jgi:hypothetical protein